MASDLELRIFYVSSWDLFVTGFVVQVSGASLYGFVMYLLDVFVVQVLDHRGLLSGFCCLRFLDSAAVCIRRIASLDASVRVC